MKLFIQFSLLIISGLVSAGPLELKNGDRVAFVGGTFVERETEHSLIETYLTLANPDKDIKFRNLGWSADTVKGESRGYFKIHEGYGLLLQKVEETKPTVIVLTYGANASWNGANGLTSFITDYTKLITTLKEKTGARIILMSTPRQENLGAPYPNPDKHNEDQSLYFTAIKKIAGAQNLSFIDLFNEFKDVKGFTSNSIHLNKKGYHAVAKYLSELRKNYSATAIDIDAANNTSQASSGKLSQLSASSTNVSFTFSPTGLSSFDSAKILKLSKLKQGNYELKSNGRILLTATAAEWAKGIKSSDLLVQERLLQTEILEKKTY